MHKYVVLQAVHVAVFRATAIQPHNTAVLIGSIHLAFTKKWGLIGVGIE